MKKKFLLFLFPILFVVSILTSAGVLADTAPFLPEGSGSATVVYQPDGRTKVTNATSYPYRTIVYIEGTLPNGAGYTGTGVIIAPNVVLTAGHCVYNAHNGGYASSLKVYQAYENGNVNPNTSVSASKLLANPGWISADKSALNLDGQYPLGSTDLGLIYLSKNTGLSSGWLGLSPSLVAGQEMTLLGFPGDYPGMLYKMSGTAATVSNTSITYNNISTYPGQSGGPLVNKNNQIVGINVAEATTGSPTYSVSAADASKYPNYGVPLNSTNINWILENVPDLKATALLRVYNPNSGEHLYTQNMNEVLSLVGAGWNYEGVNSQQPATGNAVYRLYNSNSGEHFYTMSAAERDSLVKSGWKYEQIAFYSDPANHTPIYRLFNPNAGTKGISHFYTSSAAERDSLVKAGWKYEQISWYGL